jgi:hypothetical protein
MNAEALAPEELPARAVIIATRGLERGLASDAQEACSRVGAVAVAWSGQPGAPALPAGVADEPLAVLAALPPGERNIPEDLVRLCTQERPGASLLLLSRESLVRPSVSLQNGRVTLIEPPFSVRRIASRLRVLLAPPGAERGEQERISVVGQVADGLVTLHQHQQPSYWVGALALDNARSEGRPVYPPALFEEGRGLVVLVPLAGGQLHETPAAGRGQLVTAAADIMFSGGDADVVGARLRALLGEDAGVAHVTARGDEWLSYWPGSAGRLWLFSPQRLPPCWDLGTAAGARGLRLPAIAGDALLILPPGSAEWATGAPRPGHSDAAPEDLVEAAVDGGPALLDAVEARWRERVDPACALVVEVR